MEEITFQDVLTHYQMKLSELSEETETLRNMLKKAQESVEYGWKGTAADACRAKLEDVQADLTKVMSELSESMVKLSAIGETYADKTTVF